MAEDFTELLEVKRVRGMYNGLHGHLLSKINTGKKTIYESLHGGKLTFALETIQASTRAYANEPEHSQPIPIFKARFRVMGTFRYFKFKRLIENLSAEIAPQEGLNEGKLALRPWELAIWENFSAFRLDELLPASLYLPPNIFKQMEYYYVRDILDEFSFAISTDKFDGIYGSKEQEFAFLYDENQIDKNREEFSGVNEDGEAIFSCYQWNDDGSNPRCEGPVEWLSITGPKRTIKL